MTDPTFRLINAHRRASKLLDTTRTVDFDDTVYAAIERNKLDRWVSLLVTKPTTIAGLKAFADHVATYPDLEHHGAETALAIIIG